MASSAGGNPVTAETIKHLLIGYTQTEYRTILREAVNGGEGLTNCPDYNSQQYRSPKAPLPMKPRNERRNGE